MMGLFGLGKKKEKRIQEADLKSKEGLKKLLGDQLKPGIKIEGDVETSHLETPAEKEQIVVEEKIEEPVVEKTAEAVEENWTEEDEKTLNELLASLESAENRLKEIDAEIEKAKIKEKEPIKSETFEEEEQPEINEAYEKNPSLECEEEIKQKEDYIKKLKFWNFLEKKRQKWNLEYLKKKLEEIKEINLDRKEKPFLYYAFEKSANPILLYNNKDKKSGLLDLRKINKEWVEITCNFLKETGKNEGFFEFNIYGFIKIIKNVNEIQGDEGKGINSYSENAIYKIVGPNGEIIADDIKGYNETDRIYTEKTEEYKKKLEKQFLEENK